MKEAKDISMPMELNVKVSKEMSPKYEIEREDIKKRALQRINRISDYLSKATRPDIAVSAAILSRYCKNPGKHWILAKRVLRYLKGTSDLRITYTKDMKQL